MRLTSEVSSVCSECARTSFLLSLIADTRELPIVSARNDMPCRFISSDAGAATEVSCLLYLRFLAFRAEMRRSMRHQHSADQCAAIHTWLAGALVHPVAELEETLAALGGDIIRNGRAARRDGFRQHRPHAVEEPPHTRLAQPRSHRHGVNARAKQRLVGVNVADPSHESLVQEQRLDTSLVALQPRRELFERDFQRLRPQPRHSRGKLLAELDTAELPAVVIQQPAAVEREDG